MTQILLMRPGATDYNRQRRIKGRLDLPLNLEGQAEVLAALEQVRGLDVGYVYGAPTQAARETASVVAKHFGVKSKILDRLQNLDAGLWQGKAIDEVRAQQPKVYKRWQDQPETVCPPQGEMLAAARERAREAIEKIRKKHRRGIVAVVVPEPMNTLIRCQLTGEPLGDLWQAECAGSSCALIDATASHVTAI